MIRKLKSYFRRRKCYLICLSVCMVVLFFFAFNNQLDISEMDSSVFDTLKRNGGQKEVMAPMNVFDNKVDKIDDKIMGENDVYNNDNINNIRFKVNGRVNEPQHQKNVLFVRANDEKDHKDDSDDDNVKKDSINDSDKIDNDEGNSNDELNNENADGNDHKDGEVVHSHNAVMDQQQHQGGDEQEQQKQQQQQHEDNNQQDVAPPKTVLQTQKWFGNLTESGQRAHRTVMAALEEDQKNTYEVDLPNLEIKEDVEFPPFIEFGKEGDPGEGGQAVQDNVDLSKSKEEREAEYKINQFNLLASKKISLHRSIRDMRRSECRAQQYDVSTFPSVSVILVFHDEAWTTLLRSVHSILDRTPRQALLEIVLLDDNSDQADLGRPLEKYLQPLKIVRLIRSSKRLGLIKARNLGFLYAKGEIIIFLDSHIECFPGWLEPLVTPIMKDPRTVTFPVIPNINKDNFGINQPKTSSVGGFRIHTMSFKWVDGGPEGEPYYRSPTMPGGLYAISRQWFHHLGAYDPELMFWGGENLEVSFKIWMCGGNIQAAACSLVGHVFRRDSPFHFDGFSKAIQKNLLRVADIWLDEFKHFYLEKFTYIFEPFGDTSVQRQLREGLQCHSFRWYVDNVHRRLIKEIDPDGIYSGTIRNEGYNECLSTSDKNGYPVVIGCSMMHFREVWQLRTNGFLSMYDKMVRVLQVPPKEGRVASYTLSMEEINVDRMSNFAAFKYDEKHRIVHIDTGLCMDVEAAPKANTIVLAQCGDSPNQRWTLQTREELQKYHKERGVTGIVW